MQLRQFKRPSVVFVLLLLLAALFLALWLPSAGQDDGIKTPKETLVVAVSSAPRTLDSRLATDAMSGRILELVSLPLLSYNDDFSMKLEAAKSLSKQGLTWTFTLRDNVMFHDGTPLTASDVARFYRSLQNMPTSPYGALVADVCQITVYNQAKIAFTFCDKEPFRANVFTRPLLKIDGRERDYPIGLGAFKVTEVSPLGSVLLSRATPSKKYVNHLKFDVVSDPVVRLLKLQKGEAHLTQNDLPPSLFNYGKEQGMVAKQTPSDTYTYLGFNFDDDTLKNPAVRRAIAMAIDADTIMTTLLGGQADHANSVLPTSHPAHTPHPKLAYEPARAMATLDEAGFTPNADGVRLRLTLSTTSNPSTLLLIQAMQEQLAKVGIEVSLNISEWGTFYGNVKKGNFQLYMLTWVGRFQPDFFKYVFHSQSLPPAGANRGRYVNPQMDTYIDNIMTGKNITENAQAVQNLQAEDMVYVPLWRRANIALMRPNVRGFTLDSEGSYKALLTTQLK